MAALIPAEPLNRKQREELIIKLVRERPSLYDMARKDYLDTEKRENAFAAIGQACGMTAKETTRKWKNLRDRFLREYKELENQVKKNDSSSNLGSSKWEPYNSLLFLSEHVSRRGIDPSKISSSTSDICVTQEDSHLPIPIKQEPLVDNEIEPLDPETDLMDDDAVNCIENGVESHDAPSETTSLENGAAPGLTTPSEPANKVKKRTDKQAQLLNVMKSVGKALAERLSSSQQEMDAEEAFGAHIVQRLRDLPPRKRKFAQIKIQEVLYTAEFDD